MSDPVVQDRALSDRERRLARWMLEHGTPEAASFLAQLDLTKVTPWRCPCGCASINFSIAGHAAPEVGLRILAEFTFGEGNDVSGIFIYQRGDVLAGVEVYGKAGDAPKTLPEPEQLRAYGVGVSGKSPS